MGEKEKQQRQVLYASMAKYVYDSARVLYQGQAERLGISQSKFQGMRTDPRYIVTEGDVMQFREVFREELAGFGEPTAVEKELAQLRAELESLREKVGKKESLNEALQERLVEALKRIEELGG